MTDYKVTEFGKTKDGKDAHLYLLENKNGLKAYVSDFGASLVRLFVPDKNGTMLDVVHGYDNAAGYERGDGGIGATVGRSANRIGGAQIEINGVTYELEKMTMAITCTAAVTITRKGYGMWKNSRKIRLHSFFTVRTATRDIRELWICM